MRISTAALALLLLLGAANSPALAQPEPPMPEIRPPGAGDASEGNWREAYDNYRRGLLEQKLSAEERPAAVREAITCLNRLNRVSEADAFLQSVVEAYPQDGAVLVQAALAYENLPRYGAMVDSQFVRGNPRGAARVVNSYERDRVRMMQLLLQGLEADRPADGDAWRQLADAVFGRRFRNGAWQLQLLTNLDTLPDYDDGWSRAADTEGAPVGEDGKPLYYDLPDSWEAARNDGERWRWALDQYAGQGDYQRLRAMLTRAAFLESQFGVQTLAHFQPLMARASDPASERTGTFALRTLKENETIAKLANGVRRFELPDEHNHIKLLQEVLEEAGDKLNRQESAARLAEVFNNRRQHPRAADYFRAAIENSRGNQRENYERQLNQIVDAWGEFNAVSVQPAGRGATVDFRFRNGKSVEFVARKVKMQQLLADVKTYIESRPPRLDWRQLDITNVGRRILHENEQQYLGEEAARWTLPLSPLEKHFDKQITVTTPLQEPGVYWLSAKLAEGNTSYIVVQIADTAILNKPLDNQQLFYVTKASNGEPIAGATLELFGFRQRGVEGRPNRYEVDTLNFAETSDAEGLVQTDLSTEGQNDNFQWLAIATTPEGRHAFMGFNALGLAPLSHSHLNQVTSYIVTDRPVYRPGQKVHYKAWVQRAEYGIDQDTSEFARKSFRVEIIDGRGEKAQAVTLTANGYGAVEGEFELPADATLGQYRLNVIGHGGGWFRVEEYKKPEFEVTVEAPEETLRLGDKFTANIRANYYFGSPVVSATVKYKVTRTKRSVTWRPPRPWDWLYGEGYWWFGSNYDWYPGFSRWGCRCPAPPWMPWPNNDPPETVAEGEAPIGPDGTLKVEIDTALAKELHGDSDHTYHVEAQVVDQSRRTIVGTGDVLVARRPFKAFVWTNRGHYRVGDSIEVGVATRKPDGEPTEQTGELRLLKLDYPGEGEPPKEIEVRKWDLATTANGLANLQIKASEPGQFRLSYRVRLDADRVIEGGHVFTITGPGFDGSDFTFNDLELVPDKPEYAPGDVMRLQVNTNRSGGTVLLFVRPENGAYPTPQLVHLDGKSTVLEIEVRASDMPNLLVEAVTVSQARVHTVLKDIAVPPAPKVLNVEIAAGPTAYKPGQDATIKLRVTDADGAPVVGDLALSVYDKSVEYISGGPNSEDIRKTFWQWRRSHYPRLNDNLALSGYNMTPPNSPGMQPLGLFGHLLPNEYRSDLTLLRSTRGAVAMPMAMGPEPTMEAVEGAPVADQARERADAFSKVDAPPLQAPTVRKEFADTALWRGALETNTDGIAEVSFKMPENLTTWKIMTWAVSHGARVGSGEAEVVTRKNLLVRLQTPRFLVERDEVVLSANVHNYLEQTKQVTVRLEMDGATLEAPSQLTQEIEVPAGGDRRVDWRVKAIANGNAVVRALALTDEESDAMQLEFPVKVHGFLKRDAYSGVIAADQNSGTFEINVPSQRRAEQTRLQVNYSPTLAGAMLDALPYLIEYPHGCTEQTLNRFLPAVITQQTLRRMGVDLAAVRAKEANLNPQELGAPAERRDGWKRLAENPVFDEQELDRIVKAGVRRLQDMQLTDGGWGWFSGYGEHSSAHTTATVVRGLLVAKENQVAIVPGVLERGVEWLREHQRRQLELLANAKDDGERIDNDIPAKRWADNLDALVHLTLVRAGHPSQAMRDHLYKDRTRLAPYALAMLGVALDAEGGQADKLGMVVQNLKQFVVTDQENQTAYLNLPGGYWWFWYGSEFEAHAYFLKLLTRTEPQSDLASGLVKYLLNNRKHASYWNSTRDTALVVEAMTDYLIASEENNPEQTIEVWLDGEKRKEVRITADNLFTYDNSFLLEGSAVSPGRHTVEIRKAGGGRLYYNGYLTNFTLEEDIPRSGLEVRVTRKLYRLTPITAEAQVAGDRGQAVGQKVEKYKRQRVTNLGSVKSGDLLEVELTLESKNDYEYLVITDHKAAGFEPVEVQSGYNSNEIGAYVEYRDAVVNLFTRQLARGKRSVTYRVRAETPGQFSALPAVVQAMYAPELRGNSDEVKVRVVE